MALEVVGPRFTDLVYDYGDELMAPIDLRTQCPPFPDLRPLFVSSDISHGYLRQSVSSPTNDLFGSRKRASLPAVKL